MRITLYILRSRKRFFKIRSQRPRLQRNTYFCLKSGRGVPVPFDVLTNFRHYLAKLPLAFRPKIMYSYVIKVADSESDLGLHSTQVSEIFAFYHLVENVLCRPGRRSYVHLGQKFMQLHLLCTVNEKLMQLHSIFAVNY